MLFHFKGDSIRHSRGASLLEAAVGLPLLLALFFAAISAMQILYSMLVITEGLRLAGREAATRTQNCADAALAIFPQTLHRFGVSTETRTDALGNSLPVLSISYGANAYGIDVRTITLTSNVRISCTLCDTLGKIGFPLSARFERSYTVPLEDRSAQCPP